jgi:hypothetical protein
MAHCLPSCIKTAKRGGGAVIKISECDVSRSLTKQYVSFFLSCPHNNKTGLDPLWRMVGESSAMEAQHRNGRLGDRVVHGYVVPGLFRTRTTTHRPVQENSVPELVQIRQGRRSQSEINSN